MANSKITDYTELTTGNVAATSDFLEVVDVSDTTGAASGTNKKVKPASVVVGGFGGTSGRVVYETTGGALTDSANLTFSGTNLACGGNLSVAGTTPTISTSGTSLVLKQTGDQYGETGLKILARDGALGAQFYTAGSVSLVDFGFVTLASYGSSLRLEGRSTVQLGAGNSVSNAYNEIQLLPDTNSQAAPLSCMAAGVGSVVLCPPDLVVSGTTFIRSMTTPRVGIYVSDPQGLLHVAAKGSSQVGIIMQGAASQSGDLQRWQDSTPTVLARVKSTGEIVGPHVFTYVAKTGAYTATAQDSFIAVSAASPWALTLPAASGVAAGHMYIVKKTDNNANAITVTRAGSDTIDGATTFALSAQYKYVKIVSDGSASWHVVGSN